MTDQGDITGPAMVRVTVTSGLCLPATERPTLPDGYIDDNITGPDRELLSAFYAACNSEGGTADEIHLRGIHAAIAHAATGGTVPTPVEDASPPARPVDLAALRDPTFSDGLPPSQHRDVLRGGPDPRVSVTETNYRALAQPEPVAPTPTDKELDELLTEIDHSGKTLSWRAYARAALARWRTPAIQPVPVSERPWERKDWFDAEGRCWFRGKFEGDWCLIDTANVGSLQLKYYFSHSLPHWAIPSVPAEVQP